MINKSADIRKTIVDHDVLIQLLSNYEGLLLIHPDDEALRLTIHGLRTATDVMKTCFPEDPRRIREGRFVKYVGQCPNCDRLVDSSAKFCKHCGQALKWKEEG